VKSLLFVQGVCEAGRDASGAFGNKIGRSRIASPDLGKGLFMTMPGEYTKKGERSEEIKIFS
jgi:hypothetical protein